MLKWDAEHGKLMADISELCLRDAFISIFFMCKACSGGEIWEYVWAVDGS